MVCGINQKETCKRLNEIREKRGLSIKDIQNHFGFSTPQAVYKWMDGRALPCLDNLVILADVFQCSIDDMLVCEQF